MSVTACLRVSLGLLIFSFAFSTINAQACSGTQQDTLYVGDTSSDSACNYDTIQQAIDAATCPAGTRIYLSGEHPYTAQHLGISNKNVTLIGQGAGSHCGPALACGFFIPCPTAPLATISGSGHSGDSVITIRGASTVRVQYLTISGGHDSDSGSGGGVDYDGAGTLTLDTSTVSGNTAGYGGGINVKGTGGQATLTLLANTLIVANTAGVSGGGIRLEGAARLLALSASTLIGSNHALTGFGGGIQILGPARADIGTPGYNGNGIVVGNDAINGGGIAVLDNGNGEAVLRTFADGPTQTATRIKDNLAYTNGGGIYVKGFADACLFASRVENNHAQEGAAIFRDNDNGNTAYVDSGIYINRGFPSRLGPDCGPESIAQLGGASDCSAASPCNTINGNRTQNGDGSFSPGSVIYAFGAKLVGSRLRIQHNEAAYAISARGGWADINRCLVTDNHVTSALIRADNNSSASLVTSFGECTFADNTIDGTYVFDFTEQTSPVLSRDIIYAPGRSSVYFTPYLPGNALSVNFTMSNDTSTLNAQNPGVVQGVPYFVDVANGDYHLDPFAQTALDFAPSLGDIDLDGYSAGVDLPGIQNQFGTSDLGAYERQNLFYDCGSTDTLFCNGFEH